MLIETKSFLFKLYVEQQVPNLNSVNTFFNHLISEAYAQLNSSYAQLSCKVNVSVIKIILLYDEFSNMAIIEQSKRELDSITNRLQQPFALFLLSLLFFYLRVGAHQISASADFWWFHNSLSVLSSDISEASQVTLPL